MANILIVDDLSAIRLVQRLLLEADGHHVTECSGPFEVMDTIRDLVVEHYDLVITDMKMIFSTDGIAVSRMVHEKWPDTPVILMTAEPIREREAFCRQYGFTEIIQKPVSNEHFIERVRKVLGPK